MTYLFYYKILFAIELIIGESLFCVRLKKKPKFILRIILSLGIYFLLSIFFPIPEEFGYTPLYTSLMFFCLACFSALYLFMCYEITVVFSFFTILTAYTFQHFGYVLYTFIISLFSSLLDGINMYGSSILDFSEASINSIIVLLIYVDCLVLAFAAEYFIFFKKIKTIQTIKLKFNKVIIFTLFFIIVDVILNALITYINDQETLLKVTYVYNMISCLLLVYIEHNVIDNLDITRENEIINEALLLAEKQYRVNKETIELINIKCHDMKYQINELVEKHNISSDSIKEINDLIKVYDSNIVTSNEVLNIILSEKSLACSASKIRLTPMIDASNLDIMQKGDIYSLFGNILDNSINACKELDDLDKRCISLNVYNINDFIVISEQNYFKGTLNFDSGLPISSKDYRYHGFGMKSIKMIVNKYHGSLYIDTSNNIFSLTIIIPKH